MLSESVRGARGGVVGGGFAASPANGMLEREKLSSDQHTLSRRNAALARRFPVWRRTIASSIRPKWQHASPRTKYLHHTVKIAINN